MRRVSFRRTIPATHILAHMPAGGFRKCGQQQGLRAAMQGTGKHVLRILRPAHGALMLPASVRSTPPSC